MKQILLFLLLVFPFFGTASVFQQDLYINTGTQSYYGVNYNYTAFNSTPEDTIRNYSLFFVEDVLELTVFNNDTVPHTPYIDNVQMDEQTLLPGESYTYIIDFTGLEGTFRLYCSNAQGEMMGASTSILKGYENYDDYYVWNLFDQESGMDTLIMEGVISSFPVPGYKPDLFTINANSHPQTLEDTLAKVMSNVGDSIVISIVNSGKMSHTMHFHGYHITILSAQIETMQVGWEKDTFNLKPGEAMTILLVPNQPGHYPVHNHNLLTVNTGGYPGGMITMLEIMP